MDCRNNLPSFSVTADDLAGFSWQDDTTESRPYYQGMLVETLDSPRSAYFSQSHADQDSAHTINPLSEFRIASLTYDVPKSFEEYVPWKPDKVSVDDELFPILSSCLCNESLLSGRESDIMESTSNRLSPDYHLANIPTELANPQDSQSVAVVDSLNLQHATSNNPVTSAKITANKSSQAKRKRKPQVDRRKERYRNDPDFAERERKRQRERQRELRKNPAYVKLERERHRKNRAAGERQREQQKERQREYRKNPAYIEREKERYQNDPDFAERQRKRQKERQREYRKNPAFLKSERERQREYRKNTAIKERRREYAKKRIITPAAKERERERQRQRYQNDPVFAEHRRELQRELRKKARLRRELKEEPKEVLPE